MNILSTEEMLKSKIQKILLKMGLIILKTKYQIINLFGQRVEVYKNDKTKQIVVNHTGTNSKEDALTYIELPLNTKKRNKRFQHSKTSQMIQKQIR